MSENNKKNINLKKLIKTLVKECLSEILLEEFIKNSVQKAINENFKNTSNFVENFSTPELPIPEPPSHSAKEQISLPKPQIDKKEIIKKIMGDDINHNPYMANIFEQTIDDYKDEEELLQESTIKHAKAPEQIKEVPVDFLENWGLLGDKKENKIKKIVNSDVIDMNKEKEFEDLREKRRQLLNSLNKK
jgi:hypothetical protein